MEVLIKRTYSLCSLEPWITGLQRELTFTKVDHRHGYVPEGESRVDRTVKALYHVPVEKPTVGHFPAGLLPRVLDWLSAGGHTVKIQDYRDLERTRPQPAYDRIDQLRPGQSDAIVQVAVADQGIIVAATAFGKSFIIRQICKMYPKLRILITSPRIPVVNTLYRRISEDLGEAQVGQVGGNRVQLGRRITICTTKSLMKVNPEEVDLLLFDEVHGVGDNEVAKTLGYFNNCRKFGFTASPVRGDKSELCMEALFGRFLVEFEYDEAVAVGNVVPITVRLGTVRGHVREYGDTTRNKKYSYWCNERRNAAIAETARRVPDDEQCLIMVETLEHAMNLHRLLPDYQVVHFGSVRLEYHAYVWQCLGTTRRANTLLYVKDGENSYRLLDADSEEPGPYFTWRGTSLTEKDYLASIPATAKKPTYAGRFKEYAELETHEFRETHDTDYILIRQEEYIAGYRKSDLAMTPKEKEEIEKKFETGEIKKVIATGTWKEGEINTPRIPETVCVNSSNCWDTSVAEAISSEAC